MSKMTQRLKINKRAKACLYHNWKKAFMMTVKNKILILLRKISKNQLSIQEIFQIS